MPAKGDAPEFLPSLRFRAITQEGSRTPIIMSVGLSTGGSDNAYFLTVFAEVGGKIIRLNSKPIFANIQGGYYFDVLNNRFGIGLANWNFVWANGAHYDTHNYQIEIYRIRGNKLVRILRTVSRKMYDSGKGVQSLLELGIKATDQRKKIPLIKDTLD